jgi:pyroglutamyl-peptidase
VIRALALAMAIASTVGAAEPAILLTGFGPFAGRGVNGSETIARRLDGGLVAGRRIHVRILPVRWGEPERTLPPAVAALAPELVLGLGEGHPGRIAVELLGRNRAGHPDETGAAPPASLGDGPAERAARLAFDAAWFVDAVPPVVASRDAGAYLCNAWLWHAAALPVAKVGFVHLPPQETTGADAYAERILPAVRRLIERQFAAP